jgi:hypothetical protein
VLASEHFSLPDKELSAYAEKVASLPFVTNDGVSMTYGSAIEEICDVVQKQAQKVTRTGAVLSQPLFLLPEEDLSGHGQELVVSSRININSNFLWLM